MNMTIYVNFFYPTQQLNKLIYEYTDPLLQFKKPWIKFNNLQ